LSFNLFAAMAVLWMTRNIRDRPSNRFGYQVVE